MATALSRYGIQVTLAAASTKYQLSALLIAIDSSLPGQFRRMQLQSDLQNTVNIITGDVNLTSTRYGNIMQPGDYGPAYQDDASSFTVQDLYLMFTGSATNQLVNFEGLP